jgi:hypothetical protein
MILRINHELFIKKKLKKIRGGKEGGEQLRCHLLE